MKYFTITELCHSDYAVRADLENNPTSLVIDNLTWLTEKLLDPIREKWGAPIKVNSGFRNTYLNKQLNGAKNSQHIVGEAADITVGSQKDNKRLFDLIVDSGLEFDQLIDESNYSWLHVSLKRIGENRNEIKHL